MIIIYTSINSEELEMISDRLIVLKDGKIAC